MKEKDAHIALLIDADNISAYHIQGIMDEIAKYGITTLKRIYADWTKPHLSSWKSTLAEYGISPIQQFAYTTGKNATDSALIIDAMDMLYTSPVDIYFLVSSDSDFTKLALRLREAGKQVYGIGESKTPKAFISACNRFIYLENFVYKEIFSQQNDTLHKIKNVILQTVEDLADDDGWAFLGDVGNLLLKKRPDFDPRFYGHKKLSTLVLSLDSIESTVRTGQNASIKHYYVRLKN